MQNVTSDNMFSFSICAGCRNSHSFKFNFVGRGHRSPKNVIMYLTLFCCKLVFALTYAFWVTFWIEKMCSGKKKYILHVCLGVGLGVGHYSTRVGPLHLDGQAARSPVPVSLYCSYLHCIRLKISEQTL